MEKGSSSEQAARAEMFAQLRKENEERLAGKAEVVPETKGRRAIDLERVRDTAWEYDMGKEDSPTRETAQAMLEVQPGYVEAKTAVDTLQSRMSDLLYIKETGNAFSYDDPSGVGSTALNREFAQEIARLMKEDPLAVDDESAALLYGARLIDRARKALESLPGIEAQSKAIIEQKHQELDELEDRLLGKAAA